MEVRVIVIVIWMQTLTDINLIISYVIIACRIHG